MTRFVWRRVRRTLPLVADRTCVGVSSVLPPNVGRPRLRLACVLRTPSRSGARFARGSACCYSGGYASAATHSACYFVRPWRPCHGTPHAPAGYSLRRAPCPPVARYSSAEYGTPRLAPGGPHFFAAASMPPHSVKRRSASLAGDSCRRFGSTLLVARLQAADTALRFPSSVRDASFLLARRQSTSPHGPPLCTSKSKYASQMSPVAINVYRMYVVPVRGVPPTSRRFATNAVSL